MPVTFRARTPSISDGSKIARLFSDLPALDTYVLCFRHISTSVYKHSHLFFGAQTATIYANLQNKNGGFYTLAEIPFLKF